jgi:hypothetical protein
MGFYGVSPVLFESVSNTTASLGVNSPALGSRVNVDGEEYLFVYNGGGASITAGNAVVQSNISSKTWNVTVSSTTQVDYAIGICKHTTIATGYYGWVMTRGFATFETAGTINALAVGLMVGADGNIATAIADHTTPVCGKLLRTTTAGSGFGYFFFG